MGLQRRSTPHLLEAREQFIDSGKLGKIAYVDIHSYYGGPGDFPPNTQPPDDAGLGHVRRTRHVARLQSGHPSAQLRARAASSVMARRATCAYTCMTPCGTSWGSAGPRAFRPAAGS